MKILYFDLFSGVSANAVFSALCDIIEPQNIKFEKEKLSVLNIPCSKCTLCDNNSFSNTETEFANGISNTFLNGKSTHNDIFAAIKKIVLQIAPDLVMSSPIYCGSGFENNEPVPSVEVMQAFKDFKIPFRTLDNDIIKPSTLDGVGLVFRLANEFGLLPELEIEKIGYGTDGERIVRVITGFDKQKSLNDLFEISEGFFAQNDAVYCLK